MVMAKREGVSTAPAPITAINAAVLGVQMLAGLARVPFREPFAGPSSRTSNLAASVVRESLRAFLGSVAALPIEEFRSLERMLDDLCAVVMPPVIRAYGVEERPLELGGVPGLLYRTRSRPPECVALYLHGGGFIGTSPRMYAAFVAKLCQAMSCAVFVADYRLAPEFPFPAGLEDAASALDAIVERGVPPERLLVAGDSSGGGLANTLIVGAPLSRTYRPAGLVLFSPEVDLHHEEPSFRENARRDILPWNIPSTSYLQGLDPSPAFIHRHRASLSGFPPTFVSWGEDEMFRDALRRYVGHLQADGVAHEAHEAPGMFHGFQMLMPWAVESRQVFGDVARFVQGVLAGAPPLPPEVLWR